MMRLYARWIAAICIVSAVCSLPVTSRAQDIFPIYLTESSTVLGVAGSPGPYSPIPEYENTTTLDVRKDADAHVQDAVDGDDDSFALLSSSKRELYDRILFRYSNIAYFMHRDAFRAVTRLQNAAELFISTPNETYYNRLKLAFVQSYGIFLRTCFIYYDNEDAIEARARLMAPDSPLYDIVEPYRIFESNALAPADIDIPSPAGIIALRDSTPPADDTQATVSEGFGALRRMLSADAPEAVMLYNEVGHSGDVRRGFLSTVTELAVSDVKILLKEYRPIEETTSDHLLQLPVEQAMHRLFAFMSRDILRSADSARDYTSEARRYGDAANMMSGLRALVSGTYGTTTGPGLAVAALSTGLRYAGFLKFTVEEAEESAVTLMDPQHSDADIIRSRDSRKALAEALRFFGF